MPENVNKATQNRVIYDIYTGSNKSTNVHIRKAFRINIVLLLIAEVTNKQQTEKFITLIESMVTSEEQSLTA